MVRSTPRRRCSTSSRTPSISPLGLVPADPQKSDFGWHGRHRRRRATRTGSGAASLTVQGLPLVKPPYGRITALDLNKGELVWQIAHGETPDNIKNHPALKGVTIPRTGRQGRIGVLATKTLVIAGEGGLFTTATAGAARCCGVRQDDRRGRRRGLHAGAADRLADDLHAERHAVPDGGDQRAEFRLELLTFKVGN